MNPLFTVIGIFLLGFLGIALLRIAKNIAYLIFVLMIGWIVWVFLSPIIIPYLGNIPTDPTQFSDTFADAALKDFDTNTKNTGDRIAKSVVDDVDALMDDVENKVEAKAASGSVIPRASSLNPIVRLRNVLDRMLKSIFGIQ